MDGFRQIRLEWTKLIRFRMNASRPEVRNRPEQSLGRLRKPLTWTFVANKKGNAVTASEPGAQVRILPGAQGEVAAIAEALTRRAGALRAGDRVCGIWSRPSFHLVSHREIGDVVVTRDPEMTTLMVVPGVRGINRELCPFFEPDNLGQ